jgi:hypothetical protein
MAAAFKPDGNKQILDLLGCWRMWLDEISRGVVNDSRKLCENAMPVLNEIAVLLEKLERTGEGGSINLASQSLSSTDRQWLQDALGEGAVKISLNEAGPTTFIETATPCVWWVVRNNEQREQVAEFIEVTLIPDIDSSTMGNSP